MVGDRKWVGSAVASEGAAPFLPNGLSRASRPGGGGARGDVGASRGGDPSAGPLCRERGRPLVGASGTGAKGESGLPLHPRWACGTHRHKVAPLPPWQLIDLIGLLLCASSRLSSMEIVLGTSSRSPNQAPTYGYSYIFTAWGLPNIIRGLTASPGVPWPSRFPLILALRKLHSVLTQRMRSQRRGFAMTCSSERGGPSKGRRHTPPASFSWTSKVGLEDCGSARRKGRRTSPGLPLPLVS